MLGVEVDGKAVGSADDTQKILVPLLKPLVKVKLCSTKPGAAHSAPFQPSPQESVMLRVHFAPNATAKG